MAARARQGSEVRTRGHAWREFRRYRSPRILGAGVVAALAVRLALGGWSWRDPVAAAAMLAVYPFGEWAIHVYLLHLRPFRLRGRSVELATARSHRMHHETPDRLGMILLGPVEALALLGLAVPAVLGAGAGLLAAAGAAAPLAPLVTAALAGYVLVGIYEWVHFLIHTAYRPRSRHYRAIWRNHRLHHFKNERYWHGITTTVSDRVLGTRPDQRDVERSPTARTLA
jgi:sterol desaturase/sphingolipid hydroxylase (fatty acid hydroxylase superfamily)